MNATDPFPPVLPEELRRRAEVLFVKEQHLDRIAAAVNVPDTEPSDAVRFLALAVMYGPGAVTRDPYREFHAVGEDCHGHRAEVVIAANHLLDEAAFRARVEALNKAIRERTEAVLKRTIESLEAQLKSAGTWRADTQRELAHLRRKLERTGDKR